MLGAAAAQALSHPRFISSIDPLLQRPQPSSFVKDSNLTVSEALHNNRWIRDIRGGLSTLTLAQYLQVWDMAHETQLSPNSTDRLLWKLTEDRQFSVRSAYRMFFMANVRFACNKPIWKSKAPPRCKFFMWLVVHQRCLTADNLQRHGWPSNTTCPLCLTEPECCTHLFVHCRYTQHLWR